MSMLERVKTALQGVEVVPPPTRPSFTLAADRVLVTEPRNEAVWKCADQARITWSLTGAPGYPLTITLVRINGVLAEDVAVLAARVDPSALTLTVAVPDAAPGADYALCFTSADPTCVYSQTFAISV